MRCNVIKKGLFISVVMLSVQVAAGAGLIEMARTLFIKEEDERQQQLEHLKVEFETLQKNIQEELKSIKKKIEQTNRQMNELKEQEKEVLPAQKEFITKKIALLNEIYQTAFDVQFWHKEILSIVEQHIKLLEEYRKDPTFKALALEPRSFYTFDQVQGFIKRVFDQENKLKLLVSQKGDALVELENRKKKHAAAEKEYQEKKKEQQEFGSKPVDQQQPGELTFQQRGELLDLEEKHLSFEEQLTDLKVQAGTRKISLINTTLFVEREKIHVLKNNLNRAKAGLRISEADIQAARDTLEKRKQESLAIKDKHIDEIKQLAATKEQYKQDFETLSKRYEVSIPESEEFATWTVEVPTIDAYTILCDLGHKSTQIELINRRIEYLRAQIQLEEVKFNREEIGFAILDTWNDITQGKFRETEDILIVEKKFKEKQAEAQRDLNLTNDKRNASTNLLNVQNKELSNVREFVETVRKEKNAIFAKYPTRFTACIARLNESEKLIAERLDVSSRLIEVYSNLIGVLNGTIKQVNVILTELEIKSIWQRSEYAISWEGMKNTIPDIAYFISDIRQIGAIYISGITWQKLAIGLNKIMRSPGSLLLIVLLSLFIIGLYFVTKIH